MAHHLTQTGFDLQQACIIPDKQEHIVSTVNTYRASYRYVITTGGLGPTHDDITTQAIATAFNKPLVCFDEAVCALKAYYQTSDLSKARLKMAHFPQGSSLVPNPLSGAPGFFIENVWAFAGIPAIMKVMFEYFLKKVPPAVPWHQKSLLCEVSESLLAPFLEKVQKNYPDTSLGSYPFFHDTPLQILEDSPDTSSCALPHVAQQKKGTTLVVRGRSLPRVEAMFQELSCVINALQLNYL